MNAAPQRRMTADEFIDRAISTEFRGELLDGQVIAMAPERYGHVRTKFRAARALQDSVASAGLPCEVLIDGMALAVDSGTAFQPDALVRCGPLLPDDATRVEDAVIVLEVLLPSTAAIDTSRKLLGYFRLASVRHYLILDAEKRVVIHHARGAAGGIATSILGHGPLTLDPPGLTLDIAAFFEDDLPPG